jgi:hypothetical protein
LVVKETMGLIIDTEFGDALAIRRGYEGRHRGNISSNISFLSATLLPLHTSDDELILSKTRDYLQIP